MSRMTVRRRLAPLSLPVILMTAGAAASGGEAKLEVFRADRSGRVQPAASIDEALRHEDAEPLAVITHAPAADLRRAAAKATGGGALTIDFLANGVGEEGDVPTDVAFTRDGQRIIVAHRRSRNLTVFDAATRQVLQTIPLSGSPNALAISPDGSRAVTANIFEDTASIVDLTAGEETHVVAVGDQPGVVRITPDGATAVVGNTVSGSLSLIDVAAGVETDVIAGLAFSSSTSINFEHGTVVSRFTDFRIADNQTLLHPERFNSRVQFVDLAAGTVTPLATAANPVALDLTADGATAVVTHGSTTQLVSVIDVASQTVTKTIPVGTDLFSGTIAVNPIGTKAVVGVLNEVRVVDLVSDTVSPNIFTAGINDLVVTADGQFCLAVGFTGALVSFAAESVVANLNNVVSTNLGAHSPTGPRAALVGALFTEELLTVNTDGAAGFLEGRVPSGPPPEGDRARQASITPDGTRAAVTNILSDNVSIVCLDPPSVEAIVAAGDRPSETVITPDGATAVVANLDSTFATVIDLQTLTQTSVTISTRASQVEVSPDGQYAYIAVVASGDGVWRVDLDSLSVDGPRVFTGNMGGIFFLYQQTSGLTLSHDGATLVTCNSFDDNVSIIDTALWSEVARVPVGDFPVRAVFSPDDSQIFVSNRDGDTVSVVQNDGPASMVTATLPVGSQPFNMAVSPDGQTVYVANFADATISVLGVAADAGPIALGEPVQDIHLDGTGERLYAAGGSWSVTIGPGPAVSLDQTGEAVVIDASSGTLLQQIDTGLPPGNLAFQDGRLRGVIPSPHGDGVVLLQGCPWDLDGDGSVGTPDFLALLAQWATDPSGPPDFDGDGAVGTPDFLELLANWGACP